MNGQWLGTRKIRTNWATRKAPTNEPTGTPRYRGTYKIIKINHFDVKYSLRTKILAKRQISTQIIL
jgi:hypothetical protein